MLRRALSELFRTKTGLPDKISSYYKFKPIGWSLIKQSMSSIQLRFNYIALGGLPPIDYLPTPLSSQYLATSLLNLSC